METKIGLCMPYKNDEDVLAWTLGKIPACPFKGFYFLDTGSTDDSTNEIVRHFPEGKIIKSRIPPDTIIDFGTWRNELILEAQKDGMDWVFMLDSDETLFFEGYQNIKKYAESGESDAYRLARIDFVGDKDHYRADVFPDWQGRLFKLGKGYYYAPQIHAQLHSKGDDLIVQGQYLPHAVIYHYGWTRDINKKKLHYLNAKRAKENLPMLTRMPEGTELTDATGQPPMKDWKIYKFLGQQP